MAMQKKTAQNKKVNKPAGVDEKWVLNVVDIQQVFKKERAQLISKGCDTIESALSTELDKGMSIAVYSGGIDDKKVKHQGESR